MITETKQTIDDINLLHDEDSSEIIPRIWFKVIRRPTKNKATDVNACRLLAWVIRMCQSTFPENDYNIMPENGALFVTINQIANDLTISYSQVRSALKNLARLELIEVKSVMNRPINIYGGERVISGIDIIPNVEKIIEITTPKTN